MIEIPSNFDIDKYIERIGYKGELKNNFETLKSLSISQVRSVPFENRQVQAKLIPSLEPYDIFKRVVIDKQGGYCYELNGLLAMVLKYLGFEWYFASARPMFYPEKRPRTHLVLIVKIDNDEYLCDVAYGGDGIREPIKIANFVEVVQDYDTFRLEFDSGEYIMSSLDENMEFKKQYGFKKTPQDWIDFSLANYFNATHSNTIFTQKKLAILQSENGKIVALNDELKIVKKGEVTKIKMDYEEALRSYFNL